MDKNFWYIILVVAAFTMLFRLMPMFIKINDDNKYVKTFFSILPISIITILCLPDIFTSLGSESYDYIVCLIAMLFVVILTLLKKSLGLITICSVILVLILRGINFGSF